MKNKNLITVLVLCIALLSVFATCGGIFTKTGDGPKQYISVRGQQVMLYGKGLYRHMSAEVAPQGIAQDYVTLFIGVPLLLFSLIAARKNQLKGRYLLTGTVGYFLVTYLFYLVMGMYNELFLAYVALAGLSFFLFVALLSGFNIGELPNAFSRFTPVKSTAAFLIFTAVSIAFLWLSIVLPPLLDGSVIPIQTEHYTTLIVQGLDLAILLPAAIVSAVLFLKKKPLGYLLFPVYLVFLSILMTALTAKVIAMGMLGYNVIPVVFIIPTFNVLSVVCTIAIVRCIGQETPTPETELSKTGTTTIHSINERVHSVGG